MEPSKTDADPAKSAAPYTSAPNVRTLLTELSERMTEDALEALRKAAR